MALSQTDTVLEFGIHIEVLSLTSDKGTWMFIGINTFF